MSDFVVLSSRLVLSLVFAVSAAAKTRQFASFRDSLRALDAVPDALVGVAAVATVGAEAVIAAGAWLPVPAVLDAVFAAAFVLLAAFTAVLVRAIRAGVSASCSCFGVSHTPIGWSQVVRNAALLTVAAAGLVAQTAGTSGSDGYPPLRLWPAPVLAAVLVAALAWAGDTLAAVFGAGTG